MRYERPEYEGPDVRVLSNQNVTAAKDHECSWHFNPHAKPCTIAAGERHVKVVFMEDGVFCCHRIKMACYHGYLPE